LIEIFPNGIYSAVICDFGFANIVGTAEDMQSRIASGLEVPNKAGITAQYASPELFSRVFFGRKTATEIDRAIDVYAFGVTVYELVTGEKAWNGVEQNDIRQRVIQGIKESNDLSVGDRPLIPIRYYNAFPGAKDLLKIAEASWLQSPTDRPTFEQICIQLYQLINIYAPTLK
jgi:serine/threonine protein kinase